MNLGECNKSGRNKASKELLAKSATESPGPYSLRLAPPFSQMPLVHDPSHHQLHHTSFGDDLCLVKFLGNLVNHLNQNIGDGLGNAPRLGRCGSSGVSNKSNAPGPTLEMVFAPMASPILITCAVITAGRGHRQQL